MPDIQLGNTGTDKITEGVASDGHEIYDSEGSDNATQAAFLVGFGTGGRWSRLALSAADTLGTTKPTTIVEWDTSGGAFTATLPLTPIANQIVWFKDVSPAGTTNLLTIGPNGNTAEIANLRPDGGLYGLLYDIATTNWIKIQAVDQAVHASYSAAAVLTRPARKQYIELLTSTAAGAFTLTIYATPVEGDELEFVDVEENASVNAVTLDGSGNNIGGSATFPVNVSGMSFLLRFRNGQWRVY